VSAANAEAEIRFSLPPNAAVKDLPDLVQRSLAHCDGNRVHLRATSPLTVLAPLVRWAEARNADLADLEVRRPTLEDVYLALTTPSENEETRV
jgi:ABC-2 type transport system ATP-binding protein